MATLNNLQRKEVDKSRASFLSAVAKDAQNAETAAESQYEQQLALPVGPYPSAEPPRPPESLAYYEAAAIHTLTPGWQSWASQAQSELMKDHSCH